MEIEGSGARWALKPTFDVAIRGGGGTEESVFIRVAWSSSLSQSFHHEGHDGARSQSRRKRRTRAFNFPPPRPDFATRCRPTSSPPRNSMKSVANKTCVNSVASIRRSLPGLSRQRARYSRLQELQHMDPHRNGDVGTIVDRRQERQDSDVALDEDISASRVESLLRLHAQLPCGRRVDRRAALRLALNVG